MAEAYALLLRARGVPNVFVVRPGLDLERFSPAKLQVGVVGRAYPHTGRKGEALIAQVLDLPGIEWHFTGYGWPLPSRPLADRELPEFYRRMDYILVASLYEGGPMCVPEALACGTPVIAPPVGWVPDYPHIEFATGDVADLKRVLCGVRDERLALRRSVESQTWENYTRDHDALFRRFYATSRN